MFSVIQNIASALNPLETKAIDARLEKRRHNSDNLIDEESGFNSPSAMDKEDRSSFSTKALILFLEDFLESKLGTKSSTNSNDVEQASFAPWLKTNHSNDEEAIKSKEAAKAYKHAFEVLRAPLKTFKGHNVNISRQEELKNIYSLIMDLRDLQDNGVQHLIISNKKTFIDGISDAVYMANQAQNK